MTWWMTWCHLAFIVSGNAFTIDCAGVRPGQKILDLAGGTGDLTAKFSRLVGDSGEVVLGRY